MDCNELTIQQILRECAKELDEDDERCRLTALYVEDLKKTIRDQRETISQLEEAVRLQGSTIDFLEAGRRQ